MGQSSASRQGWQKALGTKEMGGLGIDEEIAGKRTATEQHGAEHVFAVGQADENRPTESARGDGVGLDEDAIASDAGGAFHAANAGNRRMTCGGLAKMIGGDKGDAFFVIRELDVFCMEARAPRTAIGFCIERGNSKIGQRDPLPAPDDELGGARIALRQAKLGSKLKGRDLCGYGVGLEGARHRNEKTIVNPPS